MASQNNDISLTEEMEKWVSQTKRVIVAIENKILSNSQERQPELEQNYNQLEKNKQSHPLNDRLIKVKEELENAKMHLQIILKANKKHGTVLGGSKKQSKKQSKRKSNKKSKKQSKKQSKRKSNKNKF